MLRPPPSSRHVRRWERRTIFTLLLSASLIAATPVAAADPPVGADPAVITAWNAIAVTTIAGPAPTGAGKANIEANLWFAFVHAAV